MKKMIFKAFIEVNPELIKEWNYDKNENIDPLHISYGSRKKVWWTCLKNNHIWNASVRSRVNGSGCPYCSGRKVCNDNSLAIVNSALTSEWDYEKNIITPYDITVSSGVRVWWKCKDNIAHSWNVSPNKRSSGSGCPYCKGNKVADSNNLKNKNPQLASEWHPNNNGILKPEDVMAGSNIKVWWQCYKGHEWDATISSRNNGHGCPYCAGQKVCEENSLIFVRPDIAKEWNYNKNGDLKPENFTFSSGKQVWWICDRGHEWKAAITDRNKYGCQKCALDSRKGEGHHNWKGGISSISEYLRWYINEWKEKSLAHYGFRCVLTKERNDLEIHHLHPFSLIIEELFIETGLQKYETVSDYSDEELEFLKRKCLEIHYKYPLGVCLKSEIHKLFHNVYGKNGNTPEQFEEFKNKYYNDHYSNINSSCL